MVAGPGFVKQARSTAQAAGLANLCVAEYPGSFSSHTRSAVEEFLRFTDLEPEHEIGSIPPAQRAVTVRHVAVNGVMAGCPPEFMPILLAC